MILPIPLPERINRKPKPMRWDRNFDEPVPADYWGRGPDEEEPRRVEDPSDEPQRIH